MQHWFLYSVCITAGGSDLKLQTEIVEKNVHPGCMTKQQGVYMQLYAKHEFIRMRSPVVDYWIICSVWLPTI